MDSISTTTSTSQCKCGWIRLYTAPEISTRQETLPHTPKADLKFNDVWMNELIGGGNYTITKIILRDPWKHNIYLSC